MARNISGKSSSSHTDIVTQHVRDEIASGNYPPGERLREANISELLGISRTPIREAIRVLETEGLIVIEPWKGIKVAELNRNQMMDFFLFRETLEGLAAGLAAAAVSDDELEKMEAILLKTETAERDTLSDLVDSNEAFHQMIFDVAKNRFLTQSLDVLKTARLLLRGNVYRIEGVWKSSCEEHQAILSALSDRDAETASEAARRHVRSSALASLSLKLESEISA